MVDLSKFASNKKILSNIISLSYKQFWNQTLTFVYIYIYIYMWGSKNLDLCIGLKSHILLTIRPRKRNHGGAP